MANVIHIYSDGSCHNVAGGNQPMGAGIYIEIDGEGVLTKAIPLKSLGNSNIAEYRAFLQAIKYAKQIIEQNHIIEAKITFHLDSRFVVNQINSDSWIRDVYYEKLNKECKRHMSFLNRPIVKWIPRLQNKVADKMAGLARKEAIRRSQ